MADKKPTEIASLGEFGLIDHLTDSFSVRNASTLRGVGDDAAVIAAGADEVTLCTTDLLLEGVDFDLTYFPLKHLGYKARSEKPGLLGRASIALSSDVDRREAILAGEEAVRAACAGENGKMVGFIRESTSPYRAHTTLIDVNDVMLVEKKMPDEYINEAGNGVTQAFLDWCAPLIGEPLGKLISLR